MIQFEHPYYLLGLFLIVGFAGLNVYMRKWRSKALKAFGEYSVIKNLFPHTSSTKRTWKVALFYTAYAFLIIGLANPQMGATTEEVKHQGTDIMICLDVSNSMLAEDLKPNRLTQAKRSIAKLISKLEGDRIGMIIFAGSAYVQLPITTDYSAAKLFLETVNTDIIPTQGTAIGDAISLGIESFGKEEGAGRSIIVITDGENHEEGAIEAVKNAAALNIVVHTIGMGSPKGTPIPIVKRERNVGFRKDKAGNTIITKLNEKMLQEIASEGKGVYVRASNADDGLRYILNSIAELEKAEFESKTFTDYDDLFQWFLIPAFLLLLIEALITERKSDIYDQLNLFGEKQNTRDEE